MDLGKPLRIFFLPAVAVFFIILSWIWSTDLLYLANEGIHVDGDITAISIEREESYDLINNLKNEIQLVARGGDEYHIKTEQYEPVEVKHIPNEGEATKIDIIRDKLLTIGRQINKDFSGDIEVVDKANSRTYEIKGVEQGIIEITYTDSTGNKTTIRTPNKFFEIIRTVDEGGLSEINRVIDAQVKTNKTDQGIIGIEKTETATGWFQMKQRPATYVLEGELIAQVLDEKGNPIPADYNELIITAQFGSLVDQSEVEEDDRKEVPNPDITTMALGEKVDYDAFSDTRKEEFSLYREGYWGELRPIATFKHEGELHVAVSDVSQLRRQMPAFELYKPVDVIVDPKDVNHNLVTYHVDALADSQEWIVRQSSALAAIFSRWVYPFLLLTIGITCLFGWLMLASLKFFPHPEDGYELPESEKKKQAEKEAKEKAEQTQSQSQSSD